LHLAWLKDVPVLGPVFNGRDLLVWALLPAAVGVTLIFRRTLFGLQLKAAGEAPLAARAAGVRVASVRFVSILVSGAFCGLAGAELAVGSVHLFSENMTSGRGIIAFAAVIFGAGHVGRTAAACLLFGYAQALAALLQIRTEFPSQFVLMVPFLLTIVAITGSDAFRGRRSRRPGAEITPEEVRQGGAPGVVIAGHLTIDEIRLANGTTLPATIGGAAAYAALGAFLAQGDVVMVARVGQDYPVQQLKLHHLDGGRIRTGAITVLAGRSIHNIAHYDTNGARAFDIEDFDLLTEHTPGPEDLRDVMLTGRWVLVAPAPLPQQQQLIAAAKAAGALVALDTELHYLTEPGALNRLRDVVATVDCFLPSLEHIQHLFGVADASDPEALKNLVDSFGCALIIVKRGRDGVLVFGPDTPQGSVVPAVPDLDVADPTGAGDAFNGGYLVGLSRGERPTAAAVTGCVSASFAIQAIGASVPGVFSSQERAARYRHCSGIAAEMTERQELV
ncbi:MAG: PfkB family carbohydrate kinase, partial [Pseudomonadota bacterium]|nr:PfkB family carbohydrate kinase [Pseudomonadota bacterium]